jgi:hypothetical protein
MRKKICKNCGKDIPSGSVIGSGKKSEGIFCSLGCFTEYNKDKLLEKARKVQALAARHRKS